jgi:peroxiredoxin Q/BCP
MKNYKTTSGKTATIPDKDGKIIVLYFYPKDSTSGCTVEGLGFGAKFDSFTELDAVIYGVSMDSMKSHEKFKAEFDFPFELILDEDGALCREYGTLKTKNKNGVETFGVARKTFLISGSGEILFQWDTVKVDRHADEVLDAIKKYK